MRPLAASIAIITTLASAAARAQPAHRVEWLAGAALSARRSTAIDLAAIAGSRSYGVSNDAGPATLGISLRGGVLLPIDVELAATGTLSVGGLDLANIESRYLGGHAEVGSSLALGAEGGARWAPSPARGLVLLVGPAAGWQRMAASSPVGFAHLDSALVGLDVGGRLRLSTISHVVDGQLEVVLSARREIPLDVRVGKSESDVLVSGHGGGDAIYSFGCSVGYVFGFHAR